MYLGSIVCNHCTKTNHTGIEEEMTKPFYRTCDEVKNMLIENNHQRGMKRGLNGKAF
jgi:hypothetical protein